MVVFLLTNPKWLRGEFLQTFQKKSKPRQQISGDEDSSGKLLFVGSIPRTVCGMGNKAQKIQRHKESPAGVRIQSPYENKIMCLLQTSRPLRKTALINCMWPGDVKEPKNPQRLNGGTVLLCPWELQILKCRAKSSLWGCLQKVFVTNKGILIRSGHAEPPEVEDERLYLLLTFHPVELTPSGSCLKEPLISEKESRGLLLYDLFLHGPCLDQIKPFLNKTYPATGARNGESQTVASYNTP